MSEAQSTKVQLAEDQLAGWTRIPKRGKLIALKKILDDGSWITIHPFEQHQYGYAWFHRGPEINSVSQIGELRYQGSATSIAEAAEKIETYLESLNEPKLSENEQTIPVKSNPRRRSRAKKTTNPATTEES